MTILKPYLPALSFLFVLYAFRIFFSFFLDCVLSVRYVYVSFFFFLLQRVRNDGTHFTYNLLAVTMRLIYMAMGTYYMSNYLHIRMHVHNNTVLCSTGLCVCQYERRDKNLCWKDFSHDLQRVRFDDFILCLLSYNHFLLQEMGDRWLEEYKKKSNKVERKVREAKRRGDKLF